LLVGSYGRKVFTRPVSVPSRILIIVDEANR
jgi:hypothetical protein